VQQSYDIRQFSSDRFSDLRTVLYGSSFNHSHGVSMGRQVPNVSHTSAPIDPASNPVSYYPIRWRVQLLLPLPLYPTSGGLLDYEAVGSITDTEPSVQLIDDVHCLALRYLEWTSISRQHKDLRLT